MRYFDLRSLLPQTEQPSTEALPIFDHLPPEALFHFAPDSPTTAATLAEALPLLQQANLSASRHTCPDLLAQLRTALTTPIDTILCTLLDGDATLRLNAALAARYPDELSAGLDFLDKLLSPRRSWLATDETAPANWLAPIRAAARLSRRRVIPMRNDYPESDPSLLLYTLLRKRLKPNQNPAQLGVLLLDAPAAISLGHFARTGLPPSHTWIAVHHPDWPSTRYADVPTNSSLSEILPHLGLRPQDYTIRAGNLLRDQKVPPEILLYTGELTFHVTYPELPANPDPCIRCGWCLEGCPVHIHPAGLLEAAQRHNLPLARHFGLNSCIQCGICTYVCPSRLPLLHSIRQLQSP